MVQKAPKENDYCKVRTTVMNREANAIVEKSTHMTC